MIPYELLDWLDKPHNSQTWAGLKSLLPPHFQGIENPVENALVRAEAAEAALARYRDENLELENRCEVAESENERLKHGNGCPRCGSTTWYCMAGGVRKSELYGDICRDPLCPIRATAKAKNARLKSTEQVGRKGDDTMTVGVTYHIGAIWDGSGIRLVVAPLAADSEDTEMIPDEEFVGQLCTGDSDCPAIRHTHGCFADYGNCDHPDEHARADG